MLAPSAPTAHNPLFKAKCLKASSILTSSPWEVLIGKAHNDICLLEATSNQGGSDIASVWWWQQIPGALATPKHRHLTSKEAGKAGMSQFYSWVFAWLWAKQGLSVLKMWPPERGEMRHPLPHLRSELCWKVSLRPPDALCSRRILNPGSYPSCTTTLVTVGELLCGPLPSGH